MARVEISKWDVAEMFGTVYRGAYVEDGELVYGFEFKGITHRIVDDPFNCSYDAEAKEQMAERVLNAIVRDVII